MNGLIKTQHYKFTTLYIMFSPMVLSFLCLFLTLIPQATAKSEYQYASCITEGGDYAPNSTYQTNLNTVLSRLTSDTQINYGYYNSSYGQDSDRVSATGLCRGDVTPHTCRTCLNNSSFLLLKQCPLQKKAAGGYDECMLHYADNQLIFGYVDSDFMVHLSNETKATDWDQYSYVLNYLLSRLRVKAATTDSSLNRKFACGNATGVSSQTVYAAVQCSPELTVAQCNDCLDDACSEIPKCCNNRTGAMVIKLNCNIRYENYRFYEPMADTLRVQLSPQGSPSHPPAPAPSTTANSSQNTYHGKSNRSQVVIATVVPIVSSVGLLIFICIYLRARKPTNHLGSESKVDEEIKQAESFQFDFDAI